MTNVITVNNGVYCFLTKSFFVSVFLLVIILCMYAKSLMFSSSDELWLSPIDNSAFSFLLVFLFFLPLTMVNCVDSGDSDLFCVGCVLICELIFGLPFVGVVSGISSSSVGQGSDVSIGGNSPYLSMLTVV